MKGFGKKVENLFIAIAFAEAGEFDSAREIMREEDRPRDVDRISPQVRNRRELRAPSIKR